MAIIRPGRGTFPRAPIGMTIGTSPGGPTGSGRRCSCRSYPISYASVPSSRLFQGESLEDCLLQLLERTGGDRRLYSGSSIPVPMEGTHQGKRFHILALVNRDSVS